MLPNYELQRTENLPRKSRHLNLTQQEVSDGKGAWPEEGSPLQRGV